MLVEVSYVEYHTAMVRVDDKYQILVDYQNTKDDDKWDDRHGEMEDLAAECAETAMARFWNDDADDIYCNLILDAETNTFIYES